MVEVLEMELRAAEGAGAARGREQALRGMAEAMVAVEEACGGSGGGGGEAAAEVVAGVVGALREVLLAAAAERGWEEGEPRQGGTRGRAWGA